MLASTPVVKKPIPVLIEVQKLPLQYVRSYNNILQATTSNDKKKFYAAIREMEIIYPTEDQPIRISKEVATRLSKLKFLPSSPIFTQTSNLFAFSFLYIIIYDIVFCNP